MGRREDTQLKRNTTADGRYPGYEAVAPGLEAVGGRRRSGRSSETIIYWEWRGESRHPKNNMPRRWHGQMELEVDGATVTLFPCDFQLA